MTILLLTNPVTPGSAHTFERILQRLIPGYQVDTTYFLISRFKFRND